MPKFAHQMDGWRSTVDLEHQLANITKLLYSRGADEVMANYSPRRAMAAIQFEWEDKTYRVQFRPLPIKPTRSTMSEKKIQQSLRQMGFIALGHIKYLLNAGLDGANPEVMLPYDIALTSGGPTIQELGVDGFREMLAAANNGTLALNPRSEQ